MKKLLLLLIILFSVSFSFAQEEELSEKEKARREKNIQAGNPFKRFGYTPKIATLSKGKYLEFHDLDSIVRIGSFSYHVKRKKITGYTKLDTVHPESTLRPEIISRWFSPDPLSDEFPSWSPYTFVYNNPVRFVDPDGRAPQDFIIWYKDNNGKDAHFRFNGNNAHQAPNNAYVSSFLEAYCYNTSNGGGLAMREIAENKNMSVSVTSAEFFASSSSSTIRWNSEVGLLTTNGNIHSPATGLEHEADHSLSRLKDLTAHNNRLNTDDKNFNNKEEKRVITGNEQITAEYNGEIGVNQISRPNHGGVPIITNGSTSNKMNKNKTIEYYKRMGETYNIKRYIKPLEKHLDTKKILNN